MRIAGYMMSLAALVAFFAWCHVSGKRTVEVVPYTVRSPVSTFDKKPVHAQLHQDTLDTLASHMTGEPHSIALDLLVGLAKRQQQLASSDVQALLSFITAPKPEGLSDGEWEERVNVVLNALRVQENEVPGLTEYLLATTAHNPSRILRLYAMQHLMLWHHREKSAEKRQEIVELFERLAGKDGEETAGAAVMFLNDLQVRPGSNGDRGANQKVIGRVALKLAADRGAKHDVRISALHTCTERGMAEVLPAAREIAADAQATLPLRKAAVFAIGQMGGSEDLELLARLGKETPDLKHATEPAAKGLKVR